MKRMWVASAVACGLVVQGCSSRPREFRPTLAAAPTAEQRAAFDKDHAECSQLLVAGKLDSNGLLGSAAAGTAAGAATVAAGSAAASGAGFFTGAAIVGTAIIAAPFVAVGGAWAISRAKRGKKEKAIQKAMSGCLTQRGHTIVGWEKTGRKMKLDPMARKKVRAKAPAAGASAG